MPYKDINKRRAAQARYQKKKRVQLREEFASLKESTPCTDCGKYYHSYQMDFDHVSGEKLSDVNKLVRGGYAKRAREEIKKCEIVCANCHRHRTFTRKQHL